MSESSETERRQTRRAESESEIEIEIERKQNIQVRASLPHAPGRIYIYDIYMHVWSRYSQRWYAKIWEWQHAIAHGGSARVDHDAVGMHMHSGEGVATNRRFEQGLNRHVRHARSRNLRLKSG